MVEHLLENWEAVAGIIVFFTTLGGVSYTVRQNTADLKAIKEEGIFTAADCEVSQGACKAIQCLKHTRYKEDTVKMTRLIEQVSEKSDAHYESMITRMDSNNKQLIELIVTKIGGN